MRRFLFAFLLSAAVSRTLSAAAPPAKVVLLGLDGADWALLDERIAKGEMPNLAKLVSTGRSAVLESELPYLSPILWTTLATGVPPPVHGVLDFEEFDPHDGHRVPVSARSRQFPALWSTASAKGLSVGLVGWWASWPCEEIRGFCISERFAPALFDAPSEGAGIVHPKIQWKALAKLRDEQIASADRDLASVFGVDVAAAKALGPNGQKTLDGLRRLLVQARTFVRTGLSLGERVHPSLLSIYVGGTDEVGHVAAKFRPPKMAGVSDAEVRVFGRAVDGFYRETDRLIGEVAAYAAAEGAILVLVSDHGFRWGADRPALESDAANTAAYWHRKEGVLLLSGPGVKKGARGTATPYDLAPTLSALLGLPVDRSMPGKVRSDLVDAAAKPAVEDLAKGIPVKLVEVSGAVSKSAEAEQLEKLRSLGYLSGASGPSGKVAPGGKPGRTEGAWNNLGLFEREKGRLAEAERAFRKALEVSPKYSSPRTNLSDVYLRQKKWDEADAELFASVEAGNPRGEAALAARMAEYSKKGAPAGRLAKFLAAGARRLPGSRTLALAEGRRRFESNDCGGSAAVLEAFLKSVPKDTEVLNFAATARLCLGDPDGAVALFRRSLEADPRQTIPREALSRLGAR